MRKISLCIAAAMIMCFSPTMAVGAQSDLIPYANELPDERLKERLVDDADLLTSEEEEELLEKLDAISAGYVSYVINTRAILSGVHYEDGVAIRSAATQNNITMLTSLDTVKVLLDVLEEVTIGVSTIDAE